MSKHFFAAAASMAFFTAVAPASAATNLIGNGSFETPVVPSGTYVTYDAGVHLGAWVVGPKGNVAVVSDQFVYPGYTFPARTGHQWVDLTGSGTLTNESLSQTVTTTPGAMYDLTFFVGNTTGGPYGTQSKVVVYVDGKHLITAVNKEGTTTQVWKKFTTTITATGSQTTLKFVNGDPNDDQSNGLDAVSLVLHTAPANVEPGTEPSLFVK